MTVLQLLMLGASAFFAYKIYEHVQTLDDKQDQSNNDAYEPQNAQENEQDDTQRSVDAFSPFSAEELVQKADEAFENGDAKKALAFLSEANVKMPKHAEILFKLGFISAQVEDNEMAIRYYKESLDVDKNDEFVHNSLASVYRAQGEFASAKMHLNDSLALDENNPFTYYNYGNLMLDMKNEDVAKEMYVKALELNPEFEQAKEELAKLQKD